MGKRLFIDIETLPPAEEDRDRLSPIIAKTLEKTKSESSWNSGAMDVEIVVEDPFKQLALKGEFGRVLTIGLILEEDGTLKHHGLLGRDQQTGKFHLNEVRILQKFWAIVRGINLSRDVIVGHNVFDFDLPFIIKRSVVNGVNPGVRPSMRRFQNQPIFDTMKEWSCWGRNVSLNDVALALGLISPKNYGINGSQVYDAWCKGRDEEIALYCMRDVECTREVFYRLNFEKPPALVPYESKAGRPVATDNWMRLKQV